MAASDTPAPHLVSERVRLARHRTARRVMLPRLLLAAAVLACGDSSGPARNSRMERRGGPIAFMVYANDQWDVYTVDPDRGRATNLTTSPFDETFPSWSPDHRQLAYFSNRPPAGLVAVSSSGLARRQLWRGEPGAARSSWSRDGRHVYITNEDGIIVVLDLAAGAGATPRRVAFGRAPDISPDGRRLLFDDGGGISISDADGDNAVRLIDGATDPAWSPDGRRIAYALGGEDRHLIYVANADGSGARQVSDPGSCEAVDDLAPTWSASGNRLAFQRNYLSCDEYFAIIVVDADGGHQRVVSPANVDAVRPSW